MVWLKLADAQPSGNTTNFQQTIESRTFIQYSSHIIKTGNMETGYRYDNNTGSNYAITISDNGGAFAGFGSLTSMAYSSLLDANDELFVSYFLDVSGNEKLLIYFECSRNTVGAGVPPNRRKCAGKFTIATGQITELDTIQKSGAGLIDADSAVMVIGTN